MPYAAAVLAALVSAMPSLGWVANEWHKVAWSGKTACLLWTDVLGWQQARTKCQSVASDLPSIHSREDNTALRASHCNLTGYNGGCGGLAWFGAHYAGFVHTGEMVWADGSPFDFDGFDVAANSEPFRLAGEGCVGAPGWWNQDPKWYWADWVCHFAVNGACIAPLCNEPIDQCNKLCEERPCLTHGTCNLVDNTSTCTENWDDPDNPICTCGPEYQGEGCLMPADPLGAEIEQVMADLDLNSVSESEGALAATMSDALTFDIVSRLSAEERDTASWQLHEVADGFKTFCNVEGQPCDIDVDVAKFNDAMMGNCFTINHNETSARHHIRWMGMNAGMDFALNAGQQDYLPWIGSAGYKLYAHEQSDAFFGESVGVTASPGLVTAIAISFFDSTRLGGRYSDCAHDASDVKQYYYNGTYSLHGCLRSCLQVRAFDTCQCYDPRYAAPIGGEYCAREKRACLDDMLAADGDPSKWTQCQCPPNCRSRQFTYSVVHAPIVAKLSKCESAPSGANRSQCLFDARAQHALVKLYMHTTVYTAYTEVEAYPFVQIPINAGGLLGLLAGISMFSVCELLFSTVQIAIVLITGRFLHDC